MKPMPQRLFLLPLFAVLVMVAVPVGSADGAEQCPVGFHQSERTSS